jgi:hypothetical protein
LPALEQALRGMRVDDQLIELDLRGLELMDCDFVSGCVRRRVMRL